MRLPNNNPIIIIQPVTSFLCPCKAKRQHCFPSSKSWKIKDQVSALYHLKKQTAASTHTSDGMSGLFFFPSSSDLSSNYECLSLSATKTSSGVCGHNPMWHGQSRGRNWTARRKATRQGEGGGTEAMERLFPACEKKPWYQTSSLHFLKNKWCYTELWVSRTAEWCCLPWNLAATSVWRGSTLRRGSSSKIWITFSAGRQEVASGRV